MQSSTDRYSFLSGSASLISTCSSTLRRSRKKHHPLPAENASITSTQHIDCNRLKTILKPPEGLEQRIRHTKSKRTLSTRLLYCRGFFHCKHNPKNFPFYPEPNHVSTRDEPHKEEECWSVFQWICAFGTSWIKVVAQALITCLITRSQSFSFSQVIQLLVPFRIHNLPGMLVLSSNHCPRFAQCQHRGIKSI